ncbi:MAG: S1C family serine protease [Acidimicrobiales bacterium]
MSLITELQSQVGAAAQRLASATVSVGRDHRGAGVVIAPGRVLTNAHNLRDRTVQLTFEGGRTVQAAVVGVDPGHDLVVLDTDTGDATPVEWATDAPALGTIVVAAARDGGGLRVTVGTVSQESRSFRGPGGRPITVALEHTAPLARGSSGGPLADLDGRLVAVNTHRLGKGFTAAQLATSALRSTIDDLSAGRSREPLTLGVEVAPPHVAARLRAAVGLAERQGLLVRGIVAGSPAEAAGIRSGDLLVAIGDRELASPDDLFAVLAEHDPAGPLTVDVVRGADELSIEVTFAAAAQPEQPADQPAD